MTEISATKPLDPALVVGLGNPGGQYAGNRHNVGAMVLDAIAEQHGATLRRHRARASIAQIRWGTLPGGRPGPQVILARPTTYMNESGGPVKALATYYSVASPAVVVVHDDLELAFGEVRLKRGGGEAGHNGLRSVSSALGSRDYCRLRVGVGRPPGRQSPGDFVLRDFTPAERKELPFVVADAAELLEALIVRGHTVLDLPR
ncbi:Peptidyl-tRNA hydrolase [Austwickia sp. TVS 96-490-7B]|uniref:aminoacyl-tRNA hydrolase n=1 Tax=Austwickia sp. TVS 96-490-7B TaxID=2830843 RepID=UPI001D6C2398|nr:aminoacyl-tRNA hydrolase [Austwickia sp. TVS 96-490-7B]MBW3085622.1 Peptidyl-tRNA hydrolase [Austwickia sp. TVS 96-490-7B]